MAHSLGFHGDGITFRVDGFWEVEGHAVSPFDLSQMLPVGGGLLVLCS